MSTTKPDPVIEELSRTANRGDYNPWPKETTTTKSNLERECINEIRHILRELNWHINHESESYYIILHGLDNLNQLIEKIDQRD